ncbi:MAG: flagellar export chaperone FlgN [Nitrospirae bacterium]|nr:flagellar export chaperone FlgN [Nitrospirota bacterium]
MEPTLQRMKTGVGLYTRLRDLLAREQDDLVRHNLSAIESHNGEQERLLHEIADWEGEVAHLLGRDLDDSGEGQTLSQVIRELPQATRIEAERVLTTLEATARAARRLAAVNHVLVERDLATVELTLDAFTGGPAGKTYDAYGGVNRAARSTLLARKG